MPIQAPWFQEREREEEEERLRKEGKARPMGYEGRVAAAFVRKTQREEKQKAKRKKAKKK